jgi:hypothetical protein
VTRRTVGEDEGGLFSMSLHGYISTTGTDPSAMSLHREKPPGEKAGARGHRGKHISRSMFLPNTSLSSEAV